MPEKRVIALFGSADVQPGDADYALAAELGTMIGGRGWTLINGGYGGVMEASARAAKSAGGRVVGVTLTAYRRRPNEFMDEETRAGTLCARIEEMVIRATGFVALPGGTGTLAEIGFVWELMAKRLAPARPLVFVGDFWRPLVDLMKPAPGAKAACGGLVRVARDAVEAMTFLE